MSTKIENIDDFNEVNKNIKPYVGMGLTVLHNSGQSACTVVRVSKTGKTIWFQEDFSYGTNYNYTYEQNPDAMIKQARLHESGIVNVFRFGLRAVLGFRETLYVPSK